MRLATLLEGRLSNLNLSYQSENEVNFLTRFSKELNTIASNQSLNTNNKYGRPRSAPNYKTKKVERKDYNKTQETHKELLLVNKYDQVH
jgi:hypothetical protein